MILSESSQDLSHKKPETTEIQANYSETYIIRLENVLKRLIIEISFL